MVYHFNMWNLLQAKGFYFAVDSRKVFRVDQLPDLLLAREIGRYHITFPANREILVWYFENESTAKRKRGKKWSPKQWLMNTDFQVSWTGKNSHPSFMDKWTLNRQIDITALFQLFAIFLLLQYKRTSKKNSQINALQQIIMYVNA